MSFILLGILNSQAAGAGGAGGYDLLESTVLTSSASSVSFTGLDSYSNYKHLQIRAVAKSDRASLTNSELRMRFNSDTGSNYAYHLLFGNGSGVGSTAGTSATFQIINFSPAGSNNADNFGANVIDILDFSDTSKNTTSRTLSGRTESFDRIQLCSGLYNSTSAVTSIELSDEANFVAGSRFSLYGIGG